MRRARIARAGRLGRARERKREAEVHRAEGLVAARRLARRAETGVGLVERREFGPRGADDDRIDQLRVRRERAPGRRDHARGLGIVQETPQDEPSDEPRGSGDGDGLHAGILSQADGVDYLAISRTSMPLMVGLSRYGRR